MIDHYDWAGGREAMLRFGPTEGPVVVVAMPLLEEWNRTRAFVLSIMRHLVRRGLAGALPDLPGQGESLHRLADARVRTWREAFAAACAAAGRGHSRVVTLSIRGGALMDRTAPVQARWCLSPSTGPEIAREFTRLRQFGESAQRGSPVACEANLREIAGNHVHAELLNELEGDKAVSPGGPIRIVRLDSDPRPADRKLPGRPLWRASEPDNDAPLAAALADDLGDWISACAA